MKKILFIIPPITEKIWSNYIPHFYLGLGYLARIAKNKGYFIKVIDCDTTFNPPFILRKKIRKEEFDFICVTAIFGSLTNALKISKICRESSNAKIIFGGIPASFLTEEIFKKSNSIDIIVRGEGEITFQEILDGKEISLIKGISYKKNKEIINNPSREHILDLDSLGLPLRDPFPLKKYRSASEKFSGVATVETSRGCPYGCNFCTQKSKEGLRLRQRSLDLIMKDFFDISRFEFIKRIMFVDNDFLTDIERAKKILKLIIENNLNKRFSFMIATRILNLLRGGNEIFELLKEANFKIVFVGIESVSEKYIDKIGKIKNMETCISIIKKLENYNIRPLPSYIIGFPEETESDMNQTINFAKKLNTIMFSFNICTPYPGTDFYEELKEKEILKSYNYNMLNNANNLIKGNIDVEKIFKRAHKEYLFRFNYVFGNSLKDFLSFNNFFYRPVWFAYYLFRFGIKPFIRNQKRFLMKILPFERFDV